MSRRTGARFGAVIILVVGIAIGYVAAQRGLTDESVAQSPANRTADQENQPVRLTQAESTPTESTPTTQEPKAQANSLNDLRPWRDPENPNVHLLDPDDPMTKAWNARRDTSKAGEPGLFDPQRYQFGFLHAAFPTFFGAPIAKTTEDLKAGKVDVAVVGMVIEQQIVPGARFAPNAMRALPDWLQFAEGGASDTDQWVRTKYMKDLVIADYGNVTAHYTLQQRSVEEVETVISEILAADAIPLGVGGTHIQAWGFLTALAEKHGPGEFAMLHVDAHYDTYGPVFGSYIHNGSFIRQAVDRGLIKGEDIIQVGLRGVGPPDYDLKWMIDNGLRYHMMPEIEHDGWDAVLKRIFAELKGKKVYISFDLDGLDPAQAPGVGTQSLGGLTFLQAAQLIRGVSMQNEIVACEFNEYCPLLDDAHRTTGIMMDRLMRTFLAGHAARKKGITDPYYIAPTSLSHGVKD